MTTPKKNLFSVVITKKPKAKLKSCYSSCSNNDNSSMGCSDKISEIFINKEFKIFIIAIILLFISLNLILKSDSYNILCSMTLDN